MKLIRGMDADQWLALNRGGPSLHAGYPPDPHGVEQRAIGMDSHDRHVSIDEWDDELRKRSFEVEWLEYLKSN